MKKGTHQKEESKKKIAEKMKVVIRTEEWNKNLSKAAYRKWARIKLIKEKGMLYFDGRDISSNNVTL